MLDPVPVALEGRAAIELVHRHIERPMRLAQLRLHNVGIVKVRQRRPRKLRTRIEHGLCRTRLAAAVSGLLLASASMALFAATPAMANDPVPLECDPATDCKPVDPCELAPERCNPPEGGPIEEESTGDD